MPSRTLGMQPVCSLAPQSGPGAGPPAAGPGRSDVVLLPSPTRNSIPSLTGRCLPFAQTSVAWSLLAVCCSALPLYDIFGYFQSRPECAVSL